MMKFIFIAAAILAAPVSVSAAQIVLTPASVIASSGFYPQCCNFAAGNILDQQNGTVSEAFGAGYWLNEDNGPAAAYITIDLGNIYNLLQITLYNTSNGFAGDRGTGNFSIFGSNSVNLGQLVAPTLAASGTLAVGNPGNSFPVAQSFAASGSFRYLSFNPTSVASFVPIVNNIQNNYGLNELRVFGNTVPEPESWAMLVIGFGVVGAVARRRRQAMFAA
jgi:hypothetical protein